jgi:outer membrane protein insertion porin family
VQNVSGTRYKSEIIHSIGYDMLDDPIKPTDGYLANLNTSIAGLGGNAKYLKNTLRGKTYYDFEDEWVLSLSGRVSHIVGIGSDISITDRFHMGGDNLRGFANRGSGPRDKATLDALGGEWLYTTSAELSFPVGLPAELGIGGRIFSDLGALGKLSPKNSTTVDDGSLRLSSGVGMTWSSPFGPLGLDYSIPLLKKNYDQIERFRVNFGTRF